MEYLTGCLQYHFNQLNDDLDLEHNLLLLTFAKVSRFCITKWGLMIHQHGFTQGLWSASIGVIIHSKGRANIIAVAEHQKSYLQVVLSGAALHY